MTLPTLYEKRKANTIRDPFTLSGVGIHSGHHCSVTCYPQDGGGLVFQRKDIPNSPLIEAGVDFVLNTERCTTLGLAGASVATVEHLLSALNAFSIDHLLIEVEGPEIPIMDGSALPWATLLIGNVRSLDTDIPVFSLTEALFVSEGRQTAIALPSKSFKVSYTLNYPSHPLLEAQFYSYALDEDSYLKDIAPCRTFSLYEEVQPLIEAGHIKGGSLENAVIVKQDEILCRGGLRFKNEMCRHKILDFIGDICLSQWDIKAHFVLIGSGHSCHIALTKKLATLFRPELCCDA